MKDVIQVAGIIDLKEAKMLAECGVTHLGFPLRLPVNSEDSSDVESADIIEDLKGAIEPVLITYMKDAEKIMRLCDFLNTGTVQLHGPIEEEELKKLRDLRPVLNIWKSLVIRNDDMLELEAVSKKYENLVNAFITDTYDPRTGASGATGKTHDWKMSRRLVEISKIPVILAGGLTPVNVRKAILYVGPAGVDSHTGVEDRQGRKSKVLVEAFVREAKAAFDILERTRSRSHCRSSPAENGKSSFRLSS